MAGLSGVLAGAAARLTDASARFGHPLHMDWDTYLSRDAPGGLRTPDRTSANGHCRIVRTRDGWLAVNLSRPDDLDAVPAWLECAVGDDPWRTIEAEIRPRSSADVLERAILLHLPVARVGEAEAVTLPPRPSDLSPLKCCDHQVLDLSALWAGPACGGLLAQVGMSVTKVESATRPDPTPQSSPLLDARLNGRKRRVAWAPHSEALLAALAEASILITSGRPHALARMGLEPERLFALNPRLIWVAITAHGWVGEGALRVGFGDDCAAAGGLVCRSESGPHFMGDALADPLTGVLAAIRAMEMLAEGQSGLLDMPLAGCAAWFAQEAGVR